MSNEIYDILGRLQVLKESLGPEQTKVKQLPALFKPRETSPVLSGPYGKDNATQGYLVGEGQDEDMDAEERKRLLTKFKKKELPHQNFNLAQRVTFDQLEDNPMAQAVIRRIANAHPEWFMKYGPDAVMQAVDDVTSGDTDWEEIGSSDVSAYVNYVRDALQDRQGSREEMADRRPFAEGITEAQATEDVLSTVKKKLGDYLQDVATAIQKDPDLVDKVDRAVDQIGPAVKTIKTDDGHEIKIHGNEDDGFRISIKDKEIKKPFKSLDEAVMACEMYCSHRKNKALSADYIEEKHIS